MCLLKQWFQNMVFQARWKHVKTNEKIVCPTSNLQFILQFLKYKNKHKK
jgi:hypothetical protein